MKYAIFAGRLGGDAEVRYTPAGQSVCNFKLAVNEKVKGETRTTWVACAVWGNYGEAMQPHLRKGGFITVRGDVGVHAWEGKNGPGAEITCRVDSIALGPSVNHGEESDEGRFGAPPF